MLYSNFKRIIFFAISAMFSIGVNAQDDLWKLILTFSYNDETGTASVSKCNDVAGTFTLELPATVNNEEKTYTLTSIDSQVFSGKRLKKITLPSTLVSIGQNAFYACTRLEEIVIPASLTSFGPNAFYGTSMNSIKVEEGNPVFDSRDNCNAIIETATNTLLVGGPNTVIPNSVTTLGEYINWQPYTPFGGCLNLESIVIPSTVTQIIEYAFYGCSRLSSIVVEEGNPTYDSRNNCNAIIETANNTLIQGCRNTFIPTSVKKIGAYSFWNQNQLTSIFIPANITNIGSNAFEYCSGLTDIFVERTAPAEYNCNNNAFKRVNSEAVLHVPYGTLDVYKAYAPWNQFTIVEYDPTNVEDIKIENSGKKQNVYYDLEGRKVMKPIRGKIYIINGKSIVY